MDVIDEASATSMRSLLVDHPPTPAAFRTALLAVPPRDRDGWLDRVLGLGPIPTDDPTLPRNCVPYLPCSVDPILRMVDEAGVQASDVFVDIGAGLGRAALLVHLLTGASAIGLEIQPSLVHASRDLIARLPDLRYTPIEGDAAELTRHLTTGSVFFLYCPFSGTRLANVLDNLETLARTREIRVCCVDLPLPPRPWLTLVAPPAEDLAVYRSSRAK